jgi:16S rRNA (adenine1518-N6/adenine1519-N6)-dimethyltransferase
VENIKTPGELVRRYEKRTKKRFGQHFLVDPNILGVIADVAEIEPGDRVLEIGPGCGTLTYKLLERGAKVLAIELDRDLVEFLNEQLVPGRDLEVVAGDVLQQDLGDLLDRSDTGARSDSGGGWKCAANLPYNVATEIFFRLAEVMDRISTLALMFQREVAERFVAKAGDDDYGVLSLMSRLYADAEIMMTLPPGAFRPPPRVHSAVVRFKPVPGTRIPDKDLRRVFRRVVRQAFQTRRKTLPNALKSTGVEKPRLKEAIASVGLDLRIRPERVSFEKFVELARELQSDLLDSDG